MAIILVNKYWFKEKRNGCSRITYVAYLLASFPNMIDNDHNRRRQMVNEDIKRILIDRDITTIKQAFYKILCSEIRNKNTRVFIPHKLFSHGRLEDYLSNKELEFDDSDNKPTFPRGVIAV